MALTKNIAARLRHSITIETLAVTQDAEGGMVETYTELVKTKAEILPFSGGEKYSAQQSKSQAMFRIKIRYQDALANLGTEDRILFGARVFDVQYTLNIEERRRELHFMCLERL